MSLSPQDIVAAKQEALTRLKAKGIDDTFTIKLKKTKSSDWLAQYRSNSQFRSGVIFWVNPDHPADTRELVTTILHEYGHVIWELARLRMPRLYEYLTGAFYDDEEEFAESFGRAVYMGRDYPWLERATKAYTAYLQTGVE